MSIHRGAHDHWRVILAGGGTGGHLIPGLALAEEIKSRDPYAEIIFVGSSGGIEERLVPEFGHRLVTAGLARERVRDLSKPVRWMRRAWSVMLTAGVL